MCLLGGNSEIPKILIHYVAFGTIQTLSKEKDMSGRSERYFVNLIRFIKVCVKKVITLAAFAGFPNLPHPCFLSRLPTSNGYTLQIAPP
jgi:hypothetical protein